MRQLILKVQSFLILLVLVSANVQAQKSPVDMDRFIDDLMKRMTLEEKIGQLNLPVTGEITTGQAKSRRKSSGYSSFIWYGCNSWIRNCIPYSSGIILYLEHESY